MAYLVSELLDLLSSILFHETKQRMRVVVGVDKEVKHLTRQLPAIQLDLADAERRQWKDPMVKDWLDKLHEICYELNDILDEWIAAILRSENRVHADHGRWRKTKRKQVYSTVCSSCFRGCGQSGLRPDIAYKIKELNESLDKVVDEAIGRNFKKSFQHVTASYSLAREGGHNYFPEEIIYGRHKEDIINFLLNENNQGEHPGVLVIEGKGEVGRTTIAELVYNDERIKEAFEEKIWVRVSYPFDEVRVAKMIFESLYGFEPYSFERLEVLLNSISLSILVNKFLLVLDDVREVDDRKWEKLKYSLNYGSPSSKVLVITDNKGVAEMMRCSSKITVEESNVDDRWMLCRRYAFSGNNKIEETEDLVKIGKRIMEKCMGLPLLLSAKILGSLLRYKNSKEEWQSVLDSEVWILRRPPFCPLLLCYYDLPSKIRHCFSFCAIFPKDHKLQEDKLISLWMAQGYLRATQSKEMEIIGQEYFQNLAARSFFQNFIRDENGSIIMCKMHDLVHDFAQFLTGNECVCMDQTTRSDFPWEKARHLMLKFSGSDRFRVPFDRLKKLRTLLVDSEDHPKFEGSLSDLFRKLTCLRVLKLSSISTGEITAEIKNLMHLRHLDLSYRSDLEDLPEEICELYNLLTLDLSGCANLKRLPPGIRRLINLRNLKNKDTNNLTFIPSGIERLSSLRELDEFVVNGGGPNACASNLGELKNLNQLQKCLEIRGLGNLRDLYEANKAQLKKKKHLITLVLSFDFQETEGEEETVAQDEVIIEALEPPPNLETLCINAYKGNTVFPSSWMMSVTKLSKVILFNCLKCKQLPPMGKLPSLRYLEIKSMKSVQEVGFEFLGIETDEDIVAFPKLKELRFSDMEAWEEWDISSNKVIVMPGLLRLDIQFCSKLKALPVQLLQTDTLKELTILGSRNLREQFGTVGWLMVAHISIIKIDFFRFVKGKFDRSYNCRRMWEKIQQITSANQSENSTN